MTPSVLHRFIKWPGSSSTSIEYTHRDHLGSVDAITTATGSLLRNLSFDPYGSRRESDWSKDATSTTLSQIQGDQDIYGSRGFTGHEHLDHTGIIHMNGRIYDPRLGRFLQPDPIVQNPSFSQSYNRYAYVFNSPLGFTDPSGFDGLDGGALSSFFTFFSPSLFVVSGKPVSSDFVSSDDGPGRSNLSGNTTQSPTDPMNSDTVSTVARSLVPAGRETGVDGDVVLEKKLKQAKKQERGRPKGGLSNVVLGALGVAVLDGPQPGPADLVALGILGAAGISAITGASTGTGTLSREDSSERIAFGQWRISARVFSPQLGGLADLAVLAGAIALGAQPSVEVTRINGQLAAVNNRTLAAFGIAGVRPTNLVLRPFETLSAGEQVRFNDPGVPNFRIPVTAGRNGPVLFRVNAPP